MKNNKVIYTCITGGYDEIPVYKYISKDWEYVLFTDNKELINKKKAHHWQIKPLKYCKLGNVKNSRWHKINAHKLFPNHEYSLWLDGNICIENKAPFDLFDALIDKNVLASIPTHPQRNCIYDEAKIIINNFIDYKAIVRKEVQYLKSEGYPKNNGLFETNIMFRKHNDEALIKVQNDWWRMVYKYSKRDQLSCNFVFLKNNVEVTPLYKSVGYHRNGKDYLFKYSQDHNQDKIKKIKIFPNCLAKALSFFIPVKRWRKK